MPFIDSFPEAPKEPREPKLLSEQPTIHATATVRKSEIGGWTAIGPHCSISESTFGDYSYLAGHVSMVWTDVGKFASIAAQTRINPGNHPTWRVTQHHSTYRRIQYGFDTKEDTEFFQWRKDHRCSVGHDVWIGHGVTVIAGKRSAPAPSSARARSSPKTFRLTPSPSAYPRAWSNIVSRKT